MHAQLAAVSQDVGVVAARFFKGIGKDGETRHRGGQGFTVGAASDPECIP
jgi:hypothetical protein